LNVVCASCDCIKIFSQSSNSKITQGINEINFVFTYVHDEALALLGWNKIPQPSGKITHEGDLFVTSRDFFCLRLFTTKHLHSISNLFSKAFLQQMIQFYAFNLPPLTDLSTVFAVKYILLIL